MSGLSFVRALISSLGGARFFAPVAHALQDATPTPRPSITTPNSFEDLMDKMASSPTAVRATVQKPTQKPLTPPLTTTHAAKSEVETLWQHLQSGKRIDAAFALRVQNLTRHAPAKDLADGQLEPFAAFDTAVTEAEIKNGNRIAPFYPEAVTLAAAALRQLNGAKKAESLSHIKTVLSGIASKANQNFLRAAKPSETAAQITERLLFAARLGQIAMEHPSQRFFLQNAQRTFSSGLRELYRRGDVAAANAAFWSVRAALKDEGRVDFLNAFAHKIVTTPATGAQARDPLLGRDLLLQCLLANDPSTSGHPVLHARLIESLSFGKDTEPAMADKVLWIATQAKQPALVGTPTLASFYSLADTMAQKLLASPTALADVAVMEKTTQALKTFASLPHAGPASQARALRYALQAAKAYQAAGGQESALTQFALPATATAPTGLFARLGQRVTSTVARLEIMGKRPVLAVRDQLHLVFGGAAAAAAAQEPMPTANANEPSERAPSHSAKVAMTCAA